MANPLDNEPEIIDAERQKGGTQNKIGYPWLLFMHLRDCAIILTRIPSEILLVEYNTKAGLKYENIIKTFCNVVDLLVGTVSPYRDDIFNEAFAKIEQDLKDEKQTELKTRFLIYSEVMKLLDRQGLLLEAGSDETW